MSGCKGFVMATALKLEPEQAGGTSIMAIVEHNPVIVLTNADKAEQLFAEVKAECDAFVVELTTKKGRDALRAQASKIITTKTTIDKAGLALTKQWRDQTKVVNDARAEITLRLDTMAKDVRRPLTEWEDAEKARVERCREIVERIHGAAIVTMDDTAATVRARGFEIWGVEIGSDFGDLANEAANAKEATVATLKAALVRLEKEEADRAELERLRAEAAERAEADRIAAEQAEAQRLADEQAKREADQKHRTAVKAAAKTAIMSCGADEETARKIVMAIIAGEVPAVTLRF